MDKNRKTYKQVTIQTEKRIEKIIAKQKRLKEKPEEDRQICKFVIRSDRCI